MNSVFLVLEILIFIYAAYLIAYKGELAVIYLPVVFFAQGVNNPVLPALLSYILITLFVLFFISKNLLFFKNNIFSILISLLFILLIPNSNDLVTLRPYIFSVIWLFLLIPLISSIYKKYPGRLVFKELSTAAFLILCLFVINVIISSLTGYSPNPMYGITSGVLYGNLYATDLNILAIALFIVLLQVMSKKNLLYFAIFMLSFSFIMLSLRRSVMGLCILGIGIALLMFLTPQNLSSIAAFCVFFVLVGALVIINTDFMDVFQDRYGMRNLQGKELLEEQRFLEYELVYKDMFVYQDYSPWIGFGLFDSDGNYGKGIMLTRTLHADLTTVAHSSGLLGLALYLLMMFTAFRQAYNYSSSRTDLFLLIYCSLVFIVYTITGRFSNIGAFLLLTLLLMLPLTKKSPSKKKRIVKESQEEPEQLVEKIIFPQF